MRFAIVFALLFVTAAGHVGAGAAGALDGKSFEVKVEQGGDEQTDTLIFAEGTFDSVECRQYGFSAVPYQAEKKGDRWLFSAEAHSEKEGVARWKGTVIGDSVSGTMEWIKAGQETIHYEFSGKLGS